MPTRRALLPTAVLVCCAGVVLVTALRYPHVRTLGHWQQPTSVSYPDGRQHTVVLREVRHWGDPLGLAGAYPVLVLGPDPTGNYGHAVRLAETGVDATALRVRWRTAGVTIIYGSGTVLFVPAKALLYGR